jgi:hypothetical protein
MIELERLYNCSNDDKMYIHIYINVYIVFRSEMEIFRQFFDYTYICISLYGRNRIFTYV